MSRLTPEEMRRTIEDAADARRWRAIRAKCTLGGLEVDPEMMDGWADALIRADRLAAEQEGT